MQGLTVNLTTILGSAQLLFGGCGEAMTDFVTTSSLIGAHERRKKMDQKGPGAHPNNSPRRLWVTPRVIVSLDADKTGKPFPLVIEGGPPATYGGTHFGPS
jgi:hypothetical protein